MHQTGSSAFKAVTLKLLSQVIVVSIALILLYKYLLSVYNTPS